nr:hypothetical protein [Tanacetum cinerariifolium]
MLTRFDLSLRRIDGQILLGDIAREWDASARFVITEFVEGKGGKSFSSRIQVIGRRWIKQLNLISFGVARFVVTCIRAQEVILNGDSPIPTMVIEDVVQHVAPTTTEQRLARKNELKARGTLLMALPDKHQLKFNIHKDAKTLMV